MSNIGKNLRMDKKKSESDEDYWTSAHKGFDFGDIDLLQWHSQRGDTKLSISVRKNDDVNKIDLLRCEGLTEVAENRTYDDTLAFNIISAEQDKAAQKLAKSFNPLELQFKKDMEGVKLTASKTIKNIILGLDYNLEPYKGKEEKVDLLKAAVKSHDGNAILTVVLFLKNTLKSSIFQREIVEFEDAVNVYLSYLEENHEIDELANMFLLLNKHEAAAVLKYEAAVNVQHPERKLKWIENCLSTHFQFGSIDPFLWQSVAEHKQLLEEEMNIEKHFSMQALQDIDKLNCFEELTGRKCLVDSSVMSCLIFCFLFYFNSVEPSYANPTSVKSRYNLSKKQYTWAAVRALAAIQRWPEVEDLFINKNWLGGIKMRSCIGFSKVLEVLSKTKAPIEILNKYVCCVENEEEKLSLAKKYRCHSTVIEILKNNRDRVSLMEYKAALPPHSTDFYAITDVLNNSMIRWRN